MYKNMTIGEIMSYVIFLFMGLLGLLIGLMGIIHLREQNYAIIIGSAGIIIIMVCGIIDQIRKKKTSL